MPAHPPVLTPPQAKVVEYLRGHSKAVPVAAVASNVYGSQRSGVANAQRILDALRDRGVIRLTPKGLVVLTALGRRTAS
jgi:Fe2+ or Zn2+ uptake regulation protein